MSEYLRMQQQLNGLNNGSFDMTGATSFLGGGMQMDPASLDIWTQATELENRYKSQLQIAAGMAPGETTKVMGNFMNEALELLFSTISSTETNLPIQPKKELNGGNNYNPSSNNSNVSDKNNETLKENDSSKLEDSKKIEEPTTLDNSKKTEDAEKNNKTVSDNKNVPSDAVKKYEHEIKKDVILNKSDSIKQAMKDEALSVPEKIDVLVSYKEELAKTGKNYTEKYDVQILDKIKKGLEDGTYKASDVINSLSKFNNGTISKNSASQIAGCKYKDVAAFTKALYVAAQKEGNLDAVLAMFPPVTFIQKATSGEAEDKIISSLLKNLENNVKEKTQTESKKYGIAEERADILNIHVTKMLDKAKSIRDHVPNKKYVSEESYAKEIMNYIFNNKQEKFTKNEKLYMLGLLMEGLKTNYPINRLPSGSRAVVNSNEGSDIFTRLIFRNISWGNQEKYLPEILNLYSSFNES